jgi:hypothetical protein
MLLYTRESGEDTTVRGGWGFLRQGGQVRPRICIALMLSLWGCGSSSSGTPSTNGSSGAAENASSGTSESSGASTSSGAGSQSGLGGSGINSPPSSGGGSGAAESGATDSDASAAESDAALADGSQSSGDSSTATAGDAAGGCTRDNLTSAITSYFTALAAHDPTKAPLSSSVKYTENGATVQVGMGEWKTATAETFKRSALDTDQCESVTESVIGDSGGSRIYGLRLKLVNQQITEIETIIVLGTGSMTGDYIVNNPSGLAMSASDDWETVLPVAQQETRAQLQAFMDKYLTQFPNGACNFASTCMRLEDGASIGSCTGSGVGCTSSSSGAAVLTPRHHVIDVEAGISVGFTIFIGGYTDFHMFKVRGGMVAGVHATLAEAANMMSGWPMAE